MPHPTFRGWVGIFGLPRATAAYMRFSENTGKNYLVKIFKKLESGRGGHVPTGDECHLTAYVEEMRIVLRGTGSAKWAAVHRMPRNYRPLTGDP